MLHVGEIDSLTLEIDRLASSRAAPSGAPRPGTTGELEAKSAIKPPKQRKVIESFIDKPAKVSDQMRPRAPMVSRRSEAAGSLEDRPASHSKLDAPQEGKQSLQPKLTSEKSVSSFIGSSSRASQSQYPNLQGKESVSHASPLGRSHSSGALEKAGDSDIHFVNIERASMDPEPRTRSSGQQLLAFERREPFELRSGKIISAPSSDFIIPELPRGRVLMLNILSTWGDPSYVGLMGLEVFNMDGQLVRVTQPEQQLWADPADINVLPEYENDPRTVGNLIDGVYCTCDDMHAWLAPFTKGSNHIVAMKFDADTQISMIRIWNYNKNRIHSQRGARYVQITLDHRWIFLGEIKRAPGSAADPDAASECILFTTNSDILKSIERNDPLAQMLQNKQRDDEVIERVISSKKLNWSDALKYLDSSNSDAADVTTSTARGNTAEMRQPLNQDDYLPMTQWKDNGANRRPTTGKSRKNRESGKLFQDVALELAPVMRNQAAQIRPSTAAVAKNMPPALVSRYIDLYLISSWGDPAWVGLSEVMGIDSNLEEFSLKKPLVSYCLPGQSPTSECVHVEDVESISSASIVRNIGMTSCLEDMWVLAQRRGLVIRLRFFMNTRTAIKGLRIWNFNARMEDTGIGVKHIEISVDGGPRKPLIVRKAPGDCNFDYSQFLPVSRSDMGLAHSKGLEGTYAGDKHLRTLREKARGDRGDLFSSNNVSSDMRLDYPSFLGPSDSGFKLTLGPISDSFDDRFEDLVYADKGTGADSFMGTRPAFTSTVPGRSSVDTPGRGCLLSPEPAVCLCNQQYETPITPTGCTIKFVLSSTHGDPHYIGLNGLEIFDAAGGLIPINPDQLQGIPFRDVNDLLQVKKRGFDARCIENLVEPHNNTYEDRYMWLAPCAQVGGPSKTISEVSSDKCVPNTIFVLFDQPVQIGLIRVYNYSKTPSRGVKGIEIFVDDVLVFSGDLRPSPPVSDLPASLAPTKGTSFDYGINWGSSSQPQLSQSIIFTNDPRIVSQEESRIPYSDDCIEFIDEGNRVTSTYSESMDRSSEAFGEKDVSLISRPFTSVGSKGR